MRGSNWPALLRIHDKRPLRPSTEYFCYQSVTIVGWVVAASLAMWLVYGPHKFIVHGAEEWPLAGRIAYGAMERFLWGLVLAWVVYACHFGGGGMLFTDLESKTGYGMWCACINRMCICSFLGIVQKFLSAKFWIPFSRLTFNVYLIHIYLMTVMTAGSQGYIHYDFYTIVSH